MTAAQPAVIRITRRVAARGRQGCCAGSARESADAGRLVARRANAGCCISAFGSHRSLRLCPPAALANCRRQPCGTHTRIHARGAAARALSGRRAACDRPRRRAGRHCRQRPCGRMKVDARCRELGAYAPRSGACAPLLAEGRRPGARQDAAAGEEAHGQPRAQQRPCAPEMYHARGPGRGKRAWARGSGAPALSVSAVGCRGTRPMRLGGGGVAASRRASERRGEARASLLLPCGLRGVSARAQAAPGRKRWGARPSHA